MGGYSLQPPLHLGCHDTPPAGHLACSGRRWKLHSAPTGPHSPQQDPGGEAVTAGSLALGQSSLGSQNPASLIPIHSPLGAGSSERPPRVPQPQAKTVPGVRTQSPQAQCMLHLELASTGSLRSFLRPGPGPKSTPSTGAPNLFYVYTVPWGRPDPRRFRKSQPFIGGRTEKQLSMEQFQVVGPQHPIVAVLGEDAILPCFLVPAMNAENMELRWFRTTLSQAVFIYWNQQEQSEEQMAEYRGRTSLVRDFLSEGQASVHIHKVQISDNGMYTCFFRHGGFYEEADLEVKVAGMGSDPQVHIEGPEEDGVRVVCKASGWFPKPQVQWRDLSGNKFPALSEAHTQDTEELFSVEATLVVRDSSVGNVTCSVLNPVLGQEKAMAIYIPEPFFPQASPWKPAFAVILTMLGLLLLGACYFVTKEHSTKIQVRQEKEHLLQLKEEEQQAKEEVLKAIDQRKAAYLSAWRKAPLYADWRKERFQACAGITNGVAVAEVMVTTLVPVLKSSVTSLSPKSASGSFS
ncbi:butyrophilin-like protein 1 [Ictidomys tridecemlineatus]|nr:butyrophilin-like protein 1 [Ictidomys tridecemlineatus]